MLKKGGLDTQLFMNSPMGIAIVCTITGTILNVNDAYCTILARTHEQIQGKKWMEFTHPDDVIKDVHLINTMRDTKRSQSNRVKRYLRPDNTVVHAEVKVTPLDLGIAEPMHLVMVQDISWTVRIRDTLKSKINDLRQSRVEMLNALVVVAKFRDRETGGHLRRNKKYVHLLLQALSPRHSFSNYGMHLLSTASMLHDIGKVGIPDAILLKEESLNTTEFSVMKTHTTLGAMAMLETMRHLKGDSALMYAREIAEFHHEKWDGSGYPYGLQKTEIPLTARIMAIADVYDALRSNRPYKLAFDHETSVKEITRCAGTHFDPELVDLFIENAEQFRIIFETISDD